MLPRGPQRHSSVKWSDQLCCGHYTIVQFLCMILSTGCAKPKRPRAEIGYVSFLACAHSTGWGILIQRACTRSTDLHRMLWEGYLQTVLKVGLMHTLLIDEEVTTVPVRPNGGGQTVLKHSATQDFLPCPIVQVPIWALHTWIRNSRVGKPDMRSLTRRKCSYVLTISA